MLRRACFGRLICFDGVTHARWCGKSVATVSHVRHSRLFLAMFRVQVFHKLVLAVVPNLTLVALIGLVVGVAALVIVFVSDGGEGARAVSALVRLLSRVNPHVHQQVAALVEVFLAPHALEEAVAASILHSHCLVDVSGRRKNVV